MNNKKLGFGCIRLLLLDSNNPRSIDFEQLQLNYLDWDSANIQSRKCYEIAR